MEVPKDYSTVYREEKPPVPATRGATKALDGSFPARRHRESGIDQNDLLRKLLSISKDQQNQYAMNTLQQHYTDVFHKRNKQTYKVCIDYMENGRQKERYLVRIERNTLRDVKVKLPIKGHYRLFFNFAGNQNWEEVEDEDSVLPYNEKDGAFVIHCRAFTE